MDQQDLPNVFVFSADSLRADVFADLMGEIPEIVGGVEFTNAVSTSNKTSSSMPTLMAGIYGDTLSEATDSLKFGESSAEDGITTMAEALSSIGYDCRLWSANHIVGSMRHYDRGFGDGNGGEPSWKKRAQFLAKRTGSERLFNAGRWAYFNLVSPLEERLTEDDTYYPDARGFHVEAIDALGEERTGGQMCWFHYMDTHHPFDPPQAYLDDQSFNTDRPRAALAELSSHAIITNRGEGVTDADVEDIEAAYRACAAYWRDELLTFITELERREHFVPGRDVLVITADHGEGFDRDLHGMLGHTPSPAFWEDLVRVPLVVSHPDWEPGTVDHQVSSIDLMPTVLDAVGAPVPDSAEGRVAKTPAEMHRETACFATATASEFYYGARSENGWKLFADRLKESNAVHFTSSDDSDDYERVLLTAYDDAGEEIRFEHAIDEHERPVDDPESEAYRTLELTLDEHRGALTRTQRNPSMPDEIREQLRDLGYVDDLPSQGSQRTERSRTGEP